MGFVARHPGCPTVVAGACAALLAALAALAEAGAEGEVFARVGDAVISVQDYATAVREEGRRRFYHTQPPEAELAAFYRATADQLIGRVLAVQEARRRGLRPDAKLIETRVQQVRARAAMHAGGARAPDEQFLRKLRERMEQDNLVEQLQQQVYRGVAPSDAALRRYYADHKDKFTEPARQRVSLILLKVDPSASQPTWEAARKEAAAIVERARRGADFAELARMHSADASAAKGGDMGYLHAGMLAENAQQALDKLAPGQVSDPLTVLEGVAVFKLHDRLPAQLNPYDKVRERAQSLWLQQERQRAWDAFIAGLRAATKVTVDERYLVPPGKAPVAERGAAPAAQGRPGQGRP